MCHMNKRSLYYMFACVPEPDIKIIESGNEKMPEYMTDTHWECLGSLELTADMYDCFRYFFGGDET